MEMRSEVFFGDEKVRKAYESLGEKFQEKQLKSWIDKAIEDLKKNAFCGIQIPKRLFPKEYTKRFGPLQNLWKYNLPSAWRLIYTVKNGEILLLSIILEWMKHPDYEKRFGY